MEYYGTGLYQDFFSNEIKEEYLMRLRLGQSNEKATEEMINNIEVLTKEEQYVFWLVLADTQWNNGNLLENVKKEALSVIKNNKDLKRWTDQKELEKRKKELLKLEEKLKQNPQKKEIKKDIFNKINI